MSIHSSLRSHSLAGASSRNVMKRHERVRHMMEQGNWEDTKSVFGLPKIKQTKIKTRKAAKEQTAETAEAGAAGAAAPAAGAKPAAAKPAAGKAAASKPA